MMSLEKCVVAYGYLYKTLADVLECSIQTGCVG